MTNAPPAAEKRRWVRLTRVCNQRCLFCLDRDAQNGSFVPVESVRRELAAGRREGFRRVVLSGGEPTVHPRFLEIVALARELGYEHAQIITNGRRLCYKGFLDQAVAAGLKEVTVSLHGRTPAVHDELTRVPGSFVQAVAGLRHALGTPGLIVSVDVVINALNLPTLREHLDFCVALGVREFDLLALVPFSDAWRHRARLFVDLSAAEARAHLRRALELSRRGDVRIWTNRLRAEHLEGFEELIQPPEKLHDEVRGRRRVFARRLAGGRMRCEGPSCESCFLREFCADLGALLSAGELPPLPGPLCLPEAAPPAGTFRFSEKPDVSAFADFYIGARYFAKGARCASCALASSCAGAPVREVRARGFSALRPAPEAR